MMTWQRAWRLRRIVRRGWDRHAAPVLVCAAALLLMFAATPLRAQPTRLSARTAIVPATITVGDIFHAAIRFSAPADVRLVFPDTLVLPRDIEAAGRRSLRVDTVADGLEYTATYPLAAWRPDSVTLEPARVEMVSAGGVEAVTARFVPFIVRSVLPADTAGIQPQPPKDVLGPNRLFWPLLLALAILLGALALFYAWLRRRRPRSAVAGPVPAASPRERALAYLDEVRQSGLIEAGALKEFYSRVSDVLREYVGAVEPRWSSDLTTTELAGRMRGHAPDPELASLFSILGEADLVKFARGRPAPLEALASWGAARDFVERFGPPRATMEQIAA